MRRSGRTPLVDLTRQVIDSLHLGWDSAGIDTISHPPAPTAASAPDLAGTAARPPGRRLSHRARQRSVVAAMFAIAVVAWGIGFYGLGFYLRELQRIHAWSLQTVTAATMLFYLAGICASFGVQPLLRRGRSGAVFALGGLTLAVSLVALSQVDARWQLVPAYVGLAAAWACLNNYPISSTIVAWYPTGSGPALSLALTGASVGGMVMVPLLTALEERHGFARSVSGVGLVAGVLVMLLAAAVTRRPPGAAGGPPERLAPAPTPPPAQVGLAGEPAFWTLTSGFGLALAVQVGFLLHQLNLLADRLADGQAARVVAATTFAALAGRLLFGVLSKRHDPFRLAVAYLVVQTAALGVVASAAGSAVVLAAASTAFGLGVGTLVTATPLATRAVFAHVPFEVAYQRVNVVLQAGAALGPLLTTTLHDRLGGYPHTVATLAALDAVAIALVALTPRLVAAPARRMLAASR